MGNATQIGWYNLKEDKEFCNRGFECAAWYENILVKAGKYPVEVYDFRIREREEGKEIESHINGAYVSMEGTIVSDYFGSMFCGVPVGTYDGDKNAGQKGFYSPFLYLYSLADEILNDPNTSYELLDAYEPKEIRFTSIFDGKEHITHGIFLKEGAKL